MDHLYINSKPDEYVSKMRTRYFTSLGKLTANMIKYWGSAWVCPVAEQFDLDCRELTVYEDMKPFGVFRSEIGVAYTDASVQWGILLVTCTRYASTQTPAIRICKMGAWHDQNTLALDDLDLNQKIFSKIWIEHHHTRSITSVQGASMNQMYMGLLFRRSLLPCSSNLLERKTMTKQRHC